MAAAQAHEMLDDVSYMGLREEEDHLQLYTCMETAFQFQISMREKLQRPKRKNHDTEITRSKLRGYLHYKVNEIAKSLNLIPVTNVAKDHLLTVRQKDAWFVYFGAMTAELIHVACWLRVPLKTDGSVNELINPKIFFWVLHTSYAQELEALGDLKTGLDMTTVKQHLILTTGIEST